MSATPVPQRRQRLQRSELAVPATSTRFLAKARESEADVVFLDLEDAVTPRLKDEARRMAVEALAGDWGHRTMAVRINGLDTPWALEDIVAVATHAPRLDLVLLPKAGTAFDVRFVEHVLTLIERCHPRAEPVGIELLIETAQGLAHAEEIAAASPRLEAMIFGVGDYTVDMRTNDAVFGRPSERYAVLTQPGADGQRALHWNDQWHYALARIANACRANGLRAIDGPYTDFADPEGYRACARRAAALGFEGKWAIHPSQIAIANEVFSPGEAERAWAAQVLQALAEADARGDGAVNASGVLVDLAHGKQARLIDERVRLIEGRTARASRADGRGGRG